MRNASLHLSRITSSTASLRPTATTSGIRAVTSFWLRVKTLTSSPNRCTWIRAPSSFHSTETSPVTASSIGSCGGGQHRLDRGQDLQSDHCQTRDPASLLSSHGPEIRAKHQARLKAAAGTS